MKLKQFLSVLLAIILVGSLAFQPIAASNSDNIVDKSSSENWWELHPRWSQWIAGTVGGIVGSLATSALVSGLAYPIYSSQEGVYHPGPSAALTGLMVGYPLGSALGSGFGVDKSGEALDREGNALRTYLTTSLTAGATFYGSIVLGKGLKGTTENPSVKQFINVTTGSFTLATPLISSLAGTLSYKPANDQKNQE